MCVACEHVKQVPCVRRTFPREYRRLFFGEEDDAEKVREGNASHDVFASSLRGAQGTDTFHDRPRMFVNDEGADKSIARGLEETQELCDLRDGVGSSDSAVLAKVAEKCLSMGFHNCWTFVTYVTRASAIPQVQQEEFRYDEQLTAAYVRGRIEAVEQAVLAMLRLGLVAVKVRVCVLIM